MTASTPNAPTFVPADPTPGPATAICARRTRRSSSSTCRPTSAARAATSISSATTSALTRACIEPIQRVLDAHARARLPRSCTRARGTAPICADLPANKRWRSRQTKGNERHRASATSGRAAASWCAASRAGTSSPSSRRAPARPSSTSRARARSARPIWICPAPARHRQHHPHRHHHRRLRAHDHARGERPRLRVRAARGLLRAPPTPATTTPR